MGRISVCRECIHTARNTEESSYVKEPSEGQRCGFFPHRYCQNEECLKPLEKEGIEQKGNYAWITCTDCGYENELAGEGVQAIISAVWPPGHFGTPLCPECRRTDQISRYDMGISGGTIDPQTSNLEPRGASAYWFRCWRRDVNFDPKHNMAWKASV